MLLSISELSDLTGKDRRTVKRHAGTLSMVKDGKSHKYESRDLLPLLYGYSAADGEKLDLSQERARLARLQGDKADLELKAMRGEYAKLEDVVAEVSDAFSHVRAKLLALPSKMAGLVLGMTTPAEVQATLQGVIYDALTELSSQWDEGDADDQTMD